MRADAACGRGTPSIALRLVGGAVLWPVCEGGTAPLSRARSPPRDVQGSPGVQSA